MKTLVFTVDPVVPNAEVVAEAARLLRGGGRRTLRTEIESMPGSPFPGAERREALDPALEVRQIAPAAVRPWRRSSPRPRFRACRARR